MSKRANLINVSNTYDNTGSINTNLERLNRQFENTISRDGSGPNAMEADLDMNSNDILNVNDLQVRGDLIVGEDGNVNVLVEEVRQAHEDVEGWAVEVEEARDETLQARDEIININPVGYEEQTPSELERAQARQNLGLGTAATRSEDDFAKADAVFSPEELQGALDEVRDVIDHLESIDVLEFSDTLLSLKTFIWEMDEKGLAVTDIDGAIGAWLRDDMALEIEKLRLPGGEASSSDDDLFSIDDPDGGSAFRIDGDGLTHHIGVSINDDMRVESIKSADNALEIVDGDGAIAFVLPHDRIDSSSSGGESDPWSDEDPQDVISVWVEPWKDTSRDAVVSWFSDSEDGRVRYRMESMRDWVGALSQWSRPMPDGSDRWIHSVLLPNLSPAAKYELGWPGSSETKTLRTTPRSNVKIVWASDMHNRIQEMERAATQTRLIDPDLIVLPGDLAVDDGEFTQDRMTRWINFLNNLSGWRDDGSLVPLAMILGNHDMDRIGSNRVLGPMRYIAAAAGDEDYPLRFEEHPHVFGFSVGSEVFIAAIDSGMYAPLDTHLDWLEQVLTDNYGKHRHLMVTGHAAAFGAVENFPSFDSGSYGVSLRHDMWPILEQFSDKLRAYVCGHEHILSVTAPLVFEYDPNLSNQDNWSRWRTVSSKDGIRQLGSGPVGGNRLTVDDSRATSAFSSLDGSPRLLAAMGVEMGTETSVAYGGIITPNAEMRHFWLTKHNKDEWTADAISIDGSPLYSLQEDI